MSVEVGSKSKTIKYLNIHKEGVSQDDIIAVDNRWPTPILEKQDDYLVALSRFEVPLNRVSVTAQMDNCIEVYQYNGLYDEIDDDEKNDALGGLGKQTTPTGQANIYNHRNFETLSQAADVAEKYFSACETHENGRLCMTNTSQNTGVNIAHSINMQPCHTIYDFVRKLNAQINEVLLMNEGTHKVIFPARLNGNARSLNANHPNLFCGGTQPYNISNYNQPIAWFKIEMTADYTFRVVMNHAFAQGYYIKMSKALFNMLQFKEIAPVNNVFNRTNLQGRRFMADRNVNIQSLRTMQQSRPGYNISLRNVVCAVPATGDNVDKSFIDVDNQPLTGVRTYTITEFHTHFTAPCSAADSINRIKSIVFSSSLATSSEGMTGGGYRRALTDFTIPVQSSFAWDTESLVAHSVGENAASEYSYANPNPTSGRLLIMTDPSPLYELKLEVHAKCWNFETEQFKMETIPLPPGSTFTCKLVFLSRNDIHEQERPDKIRG